MGFEANGGRDCGSGSTNEGHTGENRLIGALVCKSLELVQSEHTEGLLLDSCELG